MKKMMKFTSALLLLLLTFEATILRAQTVSLKGEIVSSSEKIVKGAPFSAEAVSESVQTLFDGNKITQNTKARLYRDSQGRFRRDEMPKPVGIGSLVYVPQVIFILDPVANQKLYLNQESKTVRRLELKSERVDKEKLFEKRESDRARVERDVESAERALEKAEREYEKRRQELEKRPNDDEETKKERVRLEKFKQQIDAQKARIKARKEQLKNREKTLETRKEASQNENNSREKKIVTGTLTQTTTNENSGNSGQNDKLKIAVKPGIVLKTTAPVTVVKPSAPTAPKSPSLPALPKGEVKNEALGTRQFEGVEAEGVRRTTTIAAGTIGNERPIEIVYERWYSKELQMIVSSTYRDPRFGEQTYRLINIKREEPDAALFALPADYTIVTKPGTQITVPSQKLFVPSQKLLVAPKPLTGN